MVGVYHRPMHAVEPEPGPVRPPWWDDPAEQGRETVRLLFAIAKRMEEQNALLRELPAAIEARVRGAGIGSLAGLLRRG